MGAQERIDKMEPIAAAIMADPEYVEWHKNHPRPWTYFVTYHDGACIQFLDANGKVILPGFIYDVEVAAVLLYAINGSS